MLSIKSGKNWSNSIDVHAKGRCKLYQTSKVLLTKTYNYSHTYRRKSEYFPVKMQTIKSASFPYFCYTVYGTIQFSHSVMSDSWRLHALQHARPPCPSPTPRACSNSCPSSRWCHPNVSSSVIPFSSCLQSLPASESFPISQFFTSGGQSIGQNFSFSISPSNEYSGLISLGLSGWNTLQSKGLSRVFPNTTVQKHQFFSAQLSL